MFHADVQKITLDKKEAESIYLAMSFMAPEGNWLWKLGEVCSKYKTILYLAAVLSGFLYYRFTPIQESPILGALLLPICLIGFPNMLYNEYARPPAKWYRNPISDVRSVFSNSVMADTVLQHHPGLKTEHESYRYSVGGYTTTVQEIVWLVLSDSFEIEVDRRILRLQ